MRPNRLFPAITLVNLYLYQAQSIAIKPGRKKNNKRQQEERTTRPNYWKSL